MEISAEGISLRFRAETGLLEGFTVIDEDRKISPLHRAPWVGSDEPMPDDEPPLIARLGGDFFCAPFATSLDGSPLHGWPPNSRWRVEDAPACEMRATLERQVSGAHLTKRLRLHDGHPFVYQSHIFDGGAGCISFANHANVSVKNGAHIRTSPKRVWETPAGPLEPDPDRGRSALVSPAQSADPCAFPGIEGPVDLTQYPWNPRHEDFVTGIEASGHDLGWTAVSRIGQNDLYLSLRNPRVIPMTMLWHSNGGRDYPPWSGRHTGCLGVEEGAAAHMLSYSRDDDLTAPLALQLGGRVEVRHVTGAINWPTGEPVLEVAQREGCLVITGEVGAHRRVPIDPVFLG